MLIFLIPILILGALYHFYATYNSDVLEHYATLREASFFLIIYGEAVIMCLAVGKPLVGLFLILLEALWLVFNYMLYRYGIGLPVSNFKKYFVMSGFICVSYIFLSLAGKISYIGIIVVVSVTCIVLLVYCAYQLVGIYYYNLVDREEKDQ